MKKLSLILILISNFCLGQIMSDEKIDENKINKWNVKSTEEYEGVYFFGFSEAESQLILSIDKNIVCAQLKSYKWAEEREELTGWFPNYLNYTNVNIKGNYFFSDQSDGEFVIYNKQKCLKLERPPALLIAEEGEYELGKLGSDSLLEFYPGKFINTSFEIINDDYLKKLSLDDLQIMRNEVFARYHYIFKSGGKMDTYFKKQEWYMGMNKNVEELLTEIEKINIKSILKIEHERKQKAP